MKIYTKTGDKGQTSLISGTRVPKNHDRIEAYGTVDELNSFIGLLADQDINANRRDDLQFIQDRLFTIGSHLAADPGKEHKFLPDLREDDITSLENAMDEWDKALPPLKNFIIPGGHPSVSIAHLARTVCRRAERQVIGLAANEEVEEIVIRYLNRLSDYFFVLSRKMALELAIPEKVWKPRK